MFYIDGFFHTNIKPSISCPKCPHYCLKKPLGWQETFKIKRDVKLPSCPRIYTNMLLEVNFLGNFLSASWLVMCRNKWGRGNALSGVSSEGVGSVWGKTAHAWWKNISSLIQVIMIWTFSLLGMNIWVWEEPVSFFLFLF